MIRQVKLFLLFFLNIYKFLMTLINLYTQDRCNFQAALILTCPPAVRQTSSQSASACERACASVRVSRLPAPSVSASAVGCGSPSAPARHRGMIGRNSGDEEAGSEGRLQRGYRRRQTRRTTTAATAVCISQVIQSSSAPFHSTVRGHE